MVLIVLSGMPGSGKSTIARQLAGYEHVDELVHLDSFKTLMQCLGDTSPKVDTTHTCWQRCGEHSLSTLIDGYLMYTQAWTPLLVEYTKRIDRAGINVILDGAQLSPEGFQALPVAEKHYWFLTCPPAERLSRLEKKLAERQVRGVKPQWIEHLQDIIALDEWVCAKYPGYVLHNETIAGTLGDMIHELPYLGRANHVHA